MTSRARPLVITLLLLSGATGLVYEVTWQKYLATLLGSHSEATAAVLGIFLLRAARRPAEHASLIAFTAWSSLVHGGVMLVQALADPTEHANLCGDVPALILVGVLFLWLGPKSGDAVAGANA